MITSPVVFYHANCQDGFCAAWVASKRLPKDTEFEPMQYGQPPPGQAWSHRQETGWRRPSPYRGVCGEGSRPALLTAGTNCALTVR
jgi:hypothetical protein